MDEQLKRSLLYVLHRGLVELRSLASGGRHEQAADLADALENIPLHILKPRDESERWIKEDLRTYQTRYTGRSYDHLATLDRRDTGDS
jgi:hypothetical protein